MNNYRPDSLVLIGAARYHQVSFYGFVEYCGEN
jgi:hypothetical protein